MRPLLSPFMGEDRSSPAKPQSRLSDVERRESAPARAWSRFVYAMSVTIIVLAVVILSRQAVTVGRNIVSRQQAADARLRAAADADAEKARIESKLAEARVARRAAREADQGAIATAATAPAVDDSNLDLPRDED